MNFLVKIKDFLNKGAISDSEKSELEVEFKALETEEQDAVKSEYEKVLALPDEASADDEVTKELKSLLKGHKTEVKNEIMDAVDKYLVEQKSLMEKKIGAYSSDQKGNREHLNNSVKALCKALFKQDTTMLKEMTTDATGTPYAGYVIDSELSAEIRHLITEYGVAPREMMAVTLSKGDLKANDLVTDVTVTWTDEASGIASTEVVLGQETLALKKLAAIVTLTNELLEDEEIDLFSFIAGRVAENIAKKIDEAFFKGDGTSTYGSFTGLLKATDLNEVTMAGSTFASMDADDLIAMVDATPQGALANSKYYMHRSIMSIVRKLKSDDGIYIYQAPSQSGPATIWGYPVVLVEAMPASTDTAADTSFVLFGDLKKACIYGSKGAIKAKRFDAGVVRNIDNDGDINLITTDREAIRWTMRVGYIRIIPTAVTKLTTAAASA